MRVGSALVTLLAKTVLAVALGGCAQTAVLELQLMLPARDAASERVFALVQVRQADANPFDFDWQPQGDADAIALGEQPTLVQLSVIGRNPEVDLHVKVRFCERPQCDGFDDASAPARWFSLEHPFYVGRRTAWAACIETLPTARPSAAVEVGRCEIHGCTVGSATVYCDGGDGQHFCELDDVDELPRELQCVGSNAQY